MELINNGNNKYTLRIIGRNKKGQITENFEVKELDLSGYASSSDIKYILNKIDALKDVIQNTQFKDLMYCLEGLKCNKEDSIMFQVNFINFNKELMKFIKLLNELIKSNMSNLIRMRETITTIIIIIDILNTKYDNSLSTLVSEKQKEFIETELHNLLLNFNDCVNFQISNINNNNFAYNYNNSLIFDIIQFGIVMFNNISYYNKLNNIKFNIKQKTINNMQ